MNLLWLLVIPAADAQDLEPCRWEIAEISLQGNETTRDEYLIKWSGLAPGQTIDEQRLRQVEQKIRDTDLFQDVSIVAEGDCGAGANISILVKEKKYHVIYPRLSRNGDGDISKGLKYQGSNLFGTGQEFSILFSRKDYASGDTADQVSLDYHVDLLEKPYALEWNYFSSDTIIADAASKLITQEESLRFAVSRDWHTGWLEIPIGVKLKLGIQQSGFEGDSSLTDREPGLYNTLGMGLVYDDVHYHSFRRTGKYLSVEVDRGIYELGSDIDTTHLLLQARFYHPLNQLDNLNSRWMISMANEKLFNLFNYSLGGADSIRGIESSSLSGNSLWLANIEYVLGFRRWPTFRMALFTDIGNTFEESTQINDHDWTQTFGIGLRWKIRSFVKTDLVIDYARDPDTGYSKIYGSTSLVF